MRIDLDPDVADADVVALLEEHLAELRSITPPESTHALDLDGLRVPEVRFFVARDDDGTIAGCVALKQLEPGHAELKSMRTASGLTGRGVGTLMLTHVIAVARADGIGRISLETGAEDFFAPAHRLYARHGFVDRSPFASYRPDPLSRFMTLALE